MRYMMLIYSQENEAATPEDMRAVAMAQALMDEARHRGIFRAGDPLQASSTPPPSACTMAKRWSPMVLTPKPKSS